LRFSSQSVIHHNYILDNKIQLYDNHSGSYWNNSNNEGNYWSDYTGFDEDGDGVGDTNLPHQGVDQYPLTEREYYLIHYLTDPCFILFLVILINSIIILFMIRKKKPKKWPNNKEIKEDVEQQEDQDSE
jgi:nitrous oxidase accessory protein